MSHLETWVPVVEPPTERQSYPPPPKFSAIERCPGCKGDGFVLALSGWALRRCERCEGTGSTGGRHP